MSDEKKKAAPPEPPIQTEREVLAELRAAAKYKWLVEWPAKPGRVAQVLAKAPDETEARRLADYFGDGATYRYESKRKFRSS